MTGRKVLVHPSVIGHVDHELRQTNVALTRKQVEDSLDIGPVSQEMQNDLYSYYGWDPLWNGGMCGAGTCGGGLYAGGPFGASMGATGLAERERPYRSGRQGGDADLALDGGDPNLRSIAEVTKYHVHAAASAISRRSCWMGRAGRPLSGHQHVELVSRATRADLAACDQGH